MKKIVLIFTVAILAAVGTVFASFPVTEKGEIKKSEEATSYSEAEVLMQQLGMEEADIAEFAPAGTEDANGTMLDEMWILVLLWFFLGFVAAHRWYAGKPAGWNILFILTGGGCGIWAIIDLIHILTGKF
jgi:hypothetical protein